jgi:hypothetical protein
MDPLYKMEMEMKKKHIFLLSISVMATSLFQSVLKVTHNKMAVCMQVPPIIPPQIPCQDTSNVL